MKIARYMSKILITAGNSFIAKSIITYLEKQGHYIFAPNKSQLNLLNNVDLFEVFKDDKYDLVIHTASKGGRRFNKDTEIDFVNNTDMLLNLLTYQRKYKFKLIVFSSGAELDVRNNLFNVHEDYFNSIPVDYYGKFKYLQTKLIEDNLNIFNLRLFNVFSEHGMNDSFIPVCINKCLQNESIEIWEDKFFTTFHGEDLAILIDFLINYKQRCRFIKFNCGYKEFLKLSNIAEKIIKLTNSKSEIIIKQNIGKSYHGNCDRLYMQGLKFNGLERGLEKYINRNYE